MHYQVLTRADLLHVENIIKFGLQPMLIIPYNKMRVCLFRAFTVSLNSTQSSLKQNFSAIFIWIIASAVQKCYINYKMSKASNWLKERTMIWTILKKAKLMLKAKDYTDETLKESIPVYNTCIYTLISPCQKSMTKRTDIFPQSCLSKDQQLKQDTSSLYLTFQKINNSNKVPLLSILPFQRSTTQKEYLFPQSCLSKDQCLKQYTFSHTFALPKINDLNKTPLP